MSILIKGMEMPKNCYECPMESANWCNILEKRVESIDRHQDCPLVEVPKHGRLIDADELATAFPNGERVTTECVKATIHHMPTIIEAEESDG